MADLKKCLDLVLDAEGGYKLHTIAGDRGGMTYAGISRNNWPDWEGWKKIDASQFDDELKEMVPEFYRVNFWNEMWGDKIIDQEVAYLIFDFGMNAVLTTAIKLCQHIVKSTPDGKFGPNTTKALNDFTQDYKERQIFLLSFSLGRIYYYKNIAWKDKRRKKDVIRSNMKFLPGWINRVQGSLENTKKFHGE